MLIFYENGHNWYVIQTVVSMADSHCARPIERCALFIARIANGFANFKMCSNVVFFLFVSYNCVCLANFPQSFTMFWKPLSQLFSNKSTPNVSIMRKFINCTCCFWSFGAVGEFVENWVCVKLKSRVKISNEFRQYQNYILNSKYHFKLQRNQQQHPS